MLLECRKLIMHAHFSAVTATVHAADGPAWAWRHAGDHCAVELEGVLTQQLLRLVPGLLTEADPVPAWALRTVAECICAAPAATLAKLQECARLASVAAALQAAACSTWREASCSQ